MNLTEAMSFIHCTDWKGSRLGLERMKELMRRLGDPQDRLRFIHVAGTNGKGSVCAMLSSILTQAGYRTGLYTSPHLCRLNERFKIDNTDISDTELIAAAEQVKLAADQMAEQPTEFEIITAMAFLWFCRRHCNVVVLEVGLGGRLDATNIIKAPDAAVICSIGLEHTEILGDTLAKIAGEKSGIIKTECPVILYGQSAEAENVVRRRCRENHAELFVTDAAQERQAGLSLDGQALDYRQRTNLALGLLGTYQYENAAVVLDTVDVLNRRGYSISETAIREGLARAEWPGRFEVLQKSPLVLADGAHNPSGAEELAKCLRQYLPGKKLVFVMGVMADKDCRAMLSAIVPLAERFYTVTPQNDRAMPSEQLKSIIETEFKKPAFDAKTVRDGIRAALQDGGKNEIVCAFGSLYQIGEIREFFHKC